MHEYIIWPNQMTHYLPRHIKHLPGCIYYTAVTSWLIVLMANRTGPSLQSSEKLMASPKSKSCDKIWWQIPSPSHSTKADGKSKSATWIRTCTHPCLYWSTILVPVTVHICISRFFGEFTLWYLFTSIHIYFALDISCIRGNILVGFQFEVTGDHHIGARTSFKN